MISSFKNYVSDQSSIGVLVFDDFNPPVLEHKELMDEAANSGFDYKIFASQIVESQNNPLNYNSKIKFMRKVFPRHARSIILDNSVKNFMEAATYMYNQGYKNLIVVSNQEGKEDLLEKFNGLEGEHGYFKFYKIKQVTKEVSIDESIQLEHVKNGDFTQFALNLPQKTSDRLAKELFNAVRKGMDLDENKKFSRHVMLEPVSERREDYVNGELFSVGQQVILKETSEVVTITHCGSNYLIVESDEKKMRKWLTDVEPLDERNKVTQDADVGDKKGTQPAKYYSGLAKSTKSKRDSHFKKGAKMSDDNPAAYKPAPGDKDAKTKPSKHTKRFRAMFGEELTEYVGMSSNITRKRFGTNIKNPDKIKAKIKTTKHADPLDAEDMDKVTMKKEQGKGLWYNIHKKRREGRPMRKPGSKGAPKASDFAKARGESIEESKGLAAKAEKSGISVSILKQVYNRGMAAWRTGHRPGTTPQQWAMARVNSFITKGKGTWGGADKDLAAKVKK
jgi:hypothetical protein